MPIDSLESLLTRSSDVVGPKKIIGWWELRRIPYNLIVGITGLITIVLVISISRIVGLILGRPAEFVPHEVMFLFAIPYGILANVLYTSGWIFELLLSGLLRRDLSIYAQASFVVGLIFSVFLTLLPAFFFALIALLALLFNGD